MKKQGPTDSRSSLVAFGDDAQDALTGPQLIRQAADVGLIVRLQRRKQTLRIDDAAALTGVSVDLMSRLENGKGSVRLDKLLTVLDGLGLALAVGPKDHPSMQLLPLPPLPSVAKPEA